MIFGHADVLNKYVHKILGPKFPLRESAQMHMAFLWNPENA